MLYPPVIEGTIPAFTGTVLTVPFSMNKGVGKGEIIGFSLKLKTIQGTKYLFTTTSTNYDVDSSCEVRFNLSAYQSKLRVGQYYKVQMAYIATNGAVGYYSTVGIVKYTTKPQLSIEGLKTGKINSSSYNYIGVYSQEGNDTSEKEYKYNFTLTDSNGVIVKTSGWQIHNSENDEKPYVTYDNFNVLFDLEKNKNYYLQYKVITNNNLEVTTSKYKIIQQQSISPDGIESIQVEQNSDNGYVVITMNGTSNTNMITGSFLLSRASNETNYAQWDEIARFTMQNAYPSDWSWKDFTVAQGVDYIYALQQYNDSDLYSERIKSENVYIDFEDMFLYDGTRQLKIRYNPKVSSFKADILEAKVDTIGSKYPFIFRNGIVNYKEFPINGLLSYLGDEEELFLTKEEIGIGILTSKYNRKFTGVTNDVPDDDYFNSLMERQPNIYPLQIAYQENVEQVNEMLTEHTETTNPVGYNIAAERIFKLKVLEWLNNGEPKLFRSPTEGNYIVRLMNNSLSPEDQVGRMLHSFTSTAYEIDECNCANLTSYGIVQTEKPIIRTLRFKTVLVDGTNLSNLLTNDYAVSVKFSDMNPGDTYNIETSDDSFSIVIGSTGFYEIDSEGTNIYSIKIDNETAQRYQYGAIRLKQPQITYGYYENSTNTFNTISLIEVDDVPARQFIGARDSILKEITDIKTNILSFYYLHFYKREELELTTEVNFNKTEQKYVISNLSELKTYSIYKFQDFKLANTNYFGYAEIGKLDRADLLLPADGFKISEDDYRYYLRKGVNNYIPVTSVDQWSEDAIFYKREPFTFYIDAADSDVVYLSQESYNRLALDVEESVLNKYPVYTNTFSIDDNSVDLSDSKEYEIGGLIKFNSIKTSAGIVLECGYNFQTITYGVENTNQTLINLKAELEEIKVKDNVKEYQNKYQEYLKYLEAALQEV